MVTHLSARLVWHDSGWNGRVCDSPMKNTSCIMHEYVRENKDEEFEAEHAGEQLKELEPSDLPPCSRDPGAFSPVSTTQLHSHPFGYTRPEDLPPYSFCAAPYGKLRNENTSSGWEEDTDVQEEILEEFFGKLEEQLSLVFFYAKDGHPLSEDHGRVLVGIGRISEIGEQIHFPDTPHPDAPHPVWARRITQNYPEEGVRLPYQEYLNEGHDMDDILCPVAYDAKEEFSYVANHVPDDTAIGMLERFLESLRAVERECHIEGDWEAKIEWVETILEEVWNNRGMYPGLEGVLNYLFEEEGQGSRYQRRVLSLMGETDEDQLEHVLEVLNEASSPREPFDEMEFWYARQKWNDLDDDRREVLKTLTGFNLTESEVKRVMDSLGYRETSIPVTYDELEENLYLLSEKDEGDDEGSTIGFETIDRGIRIDLQELEGHPPGFLILTAIST